jgi:endogenous inhibitor of DNA gyrase (YacG/DUF329 family)
MSAKYCPECGTKSSSATAKFCSSCGHNIDPLSVAKPVVAKHISRAASRDDDPDGTDVYEIPNIQTLQVSVSADIDGEDEINVGGTSFAFGAAGFVPTKFKAKNL